MASRMERYYESNHESPRRSRLNADLYHSIYEDNTEYSNIEGIARIEKTNEIDIDRIREMLRQEEEKKKKETLQPVFKKTIPMPTPEETTPVRNERNYDIRDILVKAKQEKNSDESDQYRALKNTQYNILKNIKLDDRIGKKEYLEEEESDELKQLINTITSNKALNQLGDKELSLDLLDDLKSETNTNTAVNTEAIRKILSEEKKKYDAPEEKISDTRELDKSFFTSSLNFSDEDFEDLRELGATYKRNNLLIKILIGIILLVGAVMVIFYFIK